jgi:POT family proton-dependent oligopeptide transporter
MEAKPPAKLRFPRQVKYIIGNEACERFSYYGMTSILTLYLKNQLLTGVDAADRAKEIYHLFTMAIYFLPLLGGYLADRWWGRYRTILYISLFYCLGHGMLAAYGDTLYGVYAGLGLIALGAGGIKPNVSAFLGDQFRPDQASAVAKGYGWFYWAVNFGALFGYTVIPSMARNPRIGYGWAFGVPGIFMGLATFVFWLGSKKYAHVPPAHKTGERGFLEICWMLLRDPVRITQKEREAVGCVLRILLVFAPIPLFWTLYWQTGSSWVIQAEKMAPVDIPLLPIGPFTFRGLTLDLRNFNVNSETMQSAGALLVMILIPIMTLGIYPLAERLGLRPTPLRRMGLGMFLIAVSFVICAGLQSFVDRGLQVSILWQLVPYTILEVAEVLLSATALEFAFTQAPPTMKSTLMSLWYLTSAAGNSLVVFFTELNRRFVGSSVRNEFLFYAVIMFLASAVFVLCACFYRYRDPEPAPSVATAA